MPSIEQEIAGAEKKYWYAVMDRDGETVADLTDKTCLVVGGDGIVELPKDKVAAMTRDSPVTMDDFAIDESSMQFKQLTDDVAVVAYRVDQAQSGGGTQRDIRAYDMTVWVKRNGHWEAAVHTESPVAAGSR